MNIDSKEIAQFISYILRTGEFEGWYDPVQVEPYFEAAREPDGNPELNDEMFTFLCALCNHMNEHRKDHIIYNGRIPIARRLAEWWDEYSGVNEQPVKLMANETEDMKFLSKHLTIDSNNAIIIKKFVKDFLRVMMEEDHSMAYHEGFEAVIKLCENQNNS